MSNIRKRMRMGSFDWQEYPIECWGVGNTNNQGAYNSYKNLYYKQFPLLGPTLKVENTSNYSCKAQWFTASMVFISEVGVSTSGEYDAPANAAYFSLVMYDKPAFSVVDSGYFRIFYRGQRFIKPSAKAIMTGSDYLWCCGNWGSQSNLLDTTPYDNMIVRTKMPIQASSIDIDLRVCSYSIKVLFYNVNGVYINYKTVSSGNTTNGYVLPNGTKYYTLVLYDKPSAVYARSAPFILTFNE